MKYGFTLVELLAVIVILAVLALIATPVVLSIIDDAKESAMLRSAEMYLSGVENAVMRENMNSGGNFRPSQCTISSEGNLDCEGKEGIIEVEVNGEKPKNGNIVFENGKIKEVTLTYESGTILKDSSGNLVYEGSAIKLDNWQHKLSDNTIENHIDENVDGICDKCGEIEIPGLYKLDGTFVSWEQLISVEFQSFEYYDVNNKRVKTGILAVDENGSLNEAYDWMMMQPYVNDYLNGKLIISNDVLKFNPTAFFSCANLTSVIIPASVTEIPGDVFQACSNLTSIKVSENNKTYDNRNNCNAIIETATNKLILGCQNTIIPDEVTSIGDDAFYGCSNLKTLNIPKSVTSIGRYAFNMCTSLETINYSGTKEEWNSIIKGDFWNSNCQQITVYCTDGNITISA